MKGTKRKSEERKVRKKRTKKRKGRGGGNKVQWKRKRQPTQWREEGDICKWIKNGNKSSDKEHFLLLSLH